MENVVELTELVLRLEKNHAIAFLEKISSDTSCQKYAQAREKILLTEAAKMEDYTNKSFQYVPTKNSFYVALGDETAAKTKSQTSSYVNMLADALNVSYENLASAQMPIQDVYATITDNSSTVAKADLITIGFSNYGATYFMCQYMAGKADRVTEDQWVALVGEENMPQLEELLNTMFGKLKENNLSNFDGYDLEGGLECYAYTYMSNAIHLPQIIESIRNNRYTLHYCSNNKFY